jgi:raffinose synthase
MFNGGGAVRSCILQAAASSIAATFTLSVRGCGRFLAYCSRPPSWASADGLELFSSFDPTTGALHLDIPSTRDLTCELVIRF